MPTAPKKTLYHSELVKLGPVKVTVKSEPTESTKKRGTYYITLSLDGFDRYYNPENDDCLQFFEGRVGQVITVVAEGREADATIVLVGENAEQPRQSRQQQRKAAQTRQAPREEAPARGQAASSTAEPRRQQRQSPTEQSQSARPPVDALKAAKCFIARNRTLAQIALKAAMSVAAEYEGEYKERMPDVLLTSIYASLLFGTNMGCDHRGLPMHLEYKTLLPVKSETKGAA